MAQGIVEGLPPIAELDLGQRERRHDARLLRAQPLQERLRADQARFPDLIEYLLYYTAIPLEVSGVQLPERPLGGEVAAEEEVEHMLLGAPGAAVEPLLPPGHRWGLPRRTLQLQFDLLLRQVEELRQPADQLIPERP